MEFHENLLEAILHSFNRDELTEVLLFKMNIEFESIAHGGSFRMQVFNLCRDLKRRGDLGKFIDHALTARPNNPKLAQVTAKFVSTPFNQDTQAPNALQAELLNRFPDFDFGAFFVNSFKMANKICSLSYPVPGGTKCGTGWLIGPDILITNRHVLDRVISHEISPDKVELKFDYRTDLSGQTVNPGTFASLASEDWLLADSPHADEDIVVTAALPPIDTLDYAVVRLDQAIGNKPVNGNILEDASKRGWFELPQSNSDMSVQGDIFILQHPLGKPLRLALGRITEVITNGARTRYDAITHGCSSGSLVAGLDFQILALHHAGDPNELSLRNYNQGIPLHLIHADLVRRGVELSSSNLGG